MFTLPVPERTTEERKFTKRNWDNHGLRLLDSKHYFKKKVQQCLSWPQEIKCDPKLSYPGKQCNVKRQYFYF